MEQARYARSYFDGLPGRGQARAEVQELLTLREVPSEPWNVGDRYYFLKRWKDDEQPRIVTRKGLFGDNTVLLDPAAREPGLPPAVAIVSLSQNGHFLAYSVRTTGSDDSALEILDLEREVALP